MSNVMFKLPVNGQIPNGSGMGPGQGHILNQHQHHNPQSTQQPPTTHLPMNLVKQHGQLQHHGFRQPSGPLVPPPTTNFQSQSLSNGHINHPNAHGHPHGHGHHQYPSILGGKSSINKSTSSETMTIVKDPLSNTGYSRSALPLPNSAYIRSIQMSFQQPQVQDLSISSKQPTNGSLGPGKHGTLSVAASTSTNNNVNVVNSHNIKSYSVITSVVTSGTQRHSIISAPRSSRPGSNLSLPPGINGYYPRFNPPTSNSGMKPVLGVPSTSTNAPGTNGISAAETKSYKPSQGIYNRAVAVPSHPTPPHPPPKPNSSNIVQVSTVSSASSLLSTSTTTSKLPVSLSNDHSGPSLLINKNLVVPNGGKSSLNPMGNGPVFPKGTPTFRHTLPHNTSAQQITSTLSKYASTPPPPKAGTQDFFLWFCHLVLKLENYTENDSIKNRHLMTALMAGTGPATGTGTKRPPPKRKTVRKNQSLPLNGNVFKKEETERTPTVTVSTAPPPIETPSGINILKKPRRPGGINGKKQTRPPLSAKKRALLEQSGSPTKPKRKPRVKRVIETQLKFSNNKRMNLEAMVSGPRIPIPLLNTKTPESFTELGCKEEPMDETPISPDSTSIQAPSSPPPPKLSLVHMPKDDDNVEMFQEDTDSPNSQSDEKCSLNNPKPLTRGRKISTSPLNSIGESGTHSSSTDGDTGGEAEIEPEPEGDGDGADEAEAWDQITCWCGKPYAGRAMIECEICLVWLHQSCMKIRKVPEHFQCPRCRRNSGNGNQSLQVTPLSALPSPSSILYTTPSNPFSKAPKRRPTLNSASSGLYDDMLLDGLDPD